MSARMYNVSDVMSMYASFEYRSVMDVACVRELVRFRTRMNAGLLLVPFSVLPIARVMSMDLDFLYRVAASGLCTKLFAGQIPEVMEMIPAMESFAEKCESPISLARAFLIVRGVRGARGTIWVRDVILEDSTFFNKDADMWAFVCSVWSSYKVVTEELHHGRFSWGGHSEGRHGGYSGGHFLQALATPHGYDAFESVAAALCPLIQKILSASSSSQYVLTSSDTCDVITAMEGCLLLRCNKKNEDSRIGSYNAMEFTRSLTNWAVYSDRVRLEPLTDTVWLSFIARQKHTDVYHELGLNTAADACVFLDKLKHIARPLISNIHVDPPVAVYAKS